MSGSSLLWLEHAEECTHPEGCSCLAEQYNQLATAFELKRDEARSLRDFRDRVESMIEKSIEIYSEMIDDYGKRTDRNREVDILIAQSRRDAIHALRKQLGIAPEVKS